MKTLFRIGFRKNIVFKVFKNEFGIGLVLSLIEMKQIKIDSTEFRNIENQCITMDKNTLLEIQ